MSDIQLNPRDHSDTPGESEETLASRSPRKRSPPARTTPPRPSPLYDTVETAAAKLSLDPTALRARLRRAQRAEGRSVVADLGGGITAFKFGSSWRISFPRP